MFGVTARTWARLMDYDEAARLLQQTLDPALLNAAGADIIILHKCHELPLYAACNRPSNVKQ
jgi:hypothetical protein